MEVVGSRHSLKKLLDIKVDVKWRTAAHQVKMFLSHDVRKAVFCCCCQWRPTAVCRGPGYFWDG